jgi:hypothetical protein
MGARDSLVGIATSWNVRGWNPGEGDVSAPVQTDTGGLLLYNGYRNFPRVKRPGRGVDHPTPSSAEVKENVEL